MLVRMLPRTSFPKPIVISACAFLVLQGQVSDIPFSHSDWFIELSVPVTIGQSTNKDLF